MKFKKLVGLTQIVCGLIISSLFLTSCSSLSPSNNSSSSQTIDDEIPVTNVTTQALNEKLGNIKDEETAVDAVNSFVEYVATRFEEPESDGLTSQSGTSESNADLLKQYFNIDQVAQMELNFRTKGLTTQSGDNSGGLTSSEELAEQINEYDTSGDQVNVKEIETIRDAIRMAMPNIAPDKSNPLMSQLEAHAVGWAYMTGDDGTMAANSLKLGEPLPDLLSQARQNKEELTAQAGPCAIAFVVITILQGIDYTKAVMTGEDLFGNKVSDDQEKIYFVKVGRRKEMRTKWEPVRVYYTYQNLVDAAEYVKDDVDIEYSNPYGLAMLDSGSDGIAIAGGNGGLTVAGSSLFVDFPWSSWKSQMRKGDLIFKKSTREDVVTKFSYLTHSAILYDKDRGQVFESVYSVKGANIYDIGENWGNDNYMYAVRRVDALDASDTASAVDSAVSRYQGSKYRPDVLTPLDGRQTVESLGIKDKIRYYSEWADKYNTDGIYCSKLVWLTFKDVMNDYGQLIDLDSNSTRIGSTLADKLNEPMNIIYELGLAEVDTDDYGRTVQTAFKGVSPDDIFESNFLDPSFVLLKEGSGF